MAKMGAGFGWGGGESDLKAGVNGVRGYIFAVIFNHLSYLSAAGGKMIPPSHV